MNVTRNPRAADDREARHEAKVMDVIRNRFREAMRTRSTGKLVIEIQLNRGGPTNVYTEVGITYKILEET